MAPSNYRVRRATVEDLPTLRALWNSLPSPAEDLERRLTEFQVVVSGEERVVGTLGVQIRQQHALLHSESFEDYTAADEMRPLLVDRIRTIAANHRVMRLWTREQSPFWSRLGFQPATPDILKKLPEDWARVGDRPGWVTLQLKDEEAIVSLEKELACYMEMERQRTQRVFRHARTLKLAATFVSVLIAVFIIVALLYFLKQHPGALNPAR